MLNRISAPLFFGCLIALFLGLGFAIDIWARSQDPGPIVGWTPPSPSAKPAQPSTSRPDRVAPSAAPNRPSLTVALAPPAPPVMNERRWAPDSAFAFSGHWEHVRSMYDGRSNGGSSRTFHSGDSATLKFYGTFVRLYGIVGPGGGVGKVDVDKGISGVVDFHSKSKVVHQLIFTSPPLPAGAHRITISVVDDKTQPHAHGRYINIDGAEYGL